MRRTWMTRLARLSRDERGLTLPELLIATMILAVVLVVGLSGLASIQRSAVRLDTFSRANDQARLAVERLDREIRSGNVLYDPATEGSYSSLPVGYTLRIYTQTNAPTRTPNPGYLCSIWTIDDQNRLVQNQWPPLDPAAATGWRVVAEGVVNRIVSPTVPVFTLDPDPNKGGRTVDITLVVNPDPDGSFGRTVRIETASTGRNTSYGFPQDVCGDTPA